MPKNSKKGSLPDKPWMMHKAGEHFIKTSRTARIFTIGQQPPPAGEVWIVLHGYAQLAKDFIDSFDVLAKAGHFVIAPEALSRFYAKGFSGNPAASWMTSEDRLNEIADYVHYLDEVYATFNLHSTQAKIVLLGFSQGAATASRWLASTQNKVDHFVICAGEPGRELLSPLHARLRSTALTYITGLHDPMISREAHKHVYSLMETLNASIIEFDGGHEINPDALLKVRV